MGLCQTFSGKKDRFPLEIKNWISLSQYKDAPKLSDQWASFWQGQNLTDTQKEVILALTIQMPQRGFKSPALGYLYIRMMLQMASDPKFLQEFFDVWQLLLNDKDARTALALVEQIDNLQFNNQLLGTGNLLFRIHGKLHVSWNLKTSQGKESLPNVSRNVDGWDTQAPMSDTPELPISEFVETETPWFEANKISDGPILFWDKPEIGIKQGRDSLYFRAESFLWDVKNKVGAGEKGNLSAAFFGYPNVDLKSGMIF